MRKRIYALVHLYEHSIWSKLYKWLMICAVLVSMLPLMTHIDHPSFALINFLCMVYFLLDYLLRWSTADYLFQQTGWKAFARYPLRLISILDLLSILGIAVSMFVPEGLQSIVASLKVLRIVRVLRYSRNVRTIADIFRRSRRTLVAVGSLAVGYIFLSALIIFNVEPHSFDGFFDALYWSTVSLTTVGYGDIYPVTTIGRAVAMFSSFFGIAIVALPAGIITAEYLKAIPSEPEQTR